MVVSPSSLLLSKYYFDRCYIEGLFTNQSLSDNGHWFSLKVYIHIIVNWKWIGTLCYENNDPSFFQSLRDELEETCSAARELHTTARKQLTELGQLLPADTQSKLSTTELTAEQLLQQLEDMEGEAKRAKNVRYEFQVGIYIYNKCSNSSMEV